MLKIYFFEKADPAKELEKIKTAATQASKKPTEHTLKPKAEEILNKARNMHLDDGKSMATTAKKGAAGESTKDSGKKPGAERGNGVSGDVKVKDIEK